MTSFCLFLSSACLSILPPLACSSTLLSTRPPLAPCPPQPPPNPIPLRPPSPYHTCVRACAVATPNHAPSTTLLASPCMAQVALCTVAQNLISSGNSTGAGAHGRGKLGSILVPATRFVADRLACVMPCTLFISQSSTFFAVFVPPTTLAREGEGIMTAVGRHRGCRTLTGHESEHITYHRFRTCLDSYITSGFFRCCLTKSTSTSRATPIFRCTFDVIMLHLSLSLYLQMYAHTPLHRLPAYPYTVPRNPSSLKNCPA